jgi:hypothetical protein
MSPSTSPSRRVWARIVAAVAAHAAREGLPDATPNPQACRAAAACAAKEGDVAFAEDVFKLVPADAVARIAVVAARAVAGDVETAKKHLEERLASEGIPSDSSETCSALAALARLGAAGAAMTVCETCVEPQNAGTAERLCPAVAACAESRDSRLSGAPGAETVTRAEALLDAWGQAGVAGAAAAKSKATSSAASPAETRPITAGANAGAKTETFAGPSGSAPSKKTGGASFASFASAAGGGRRAETTGGAGASASAPERPPRASSGAKGSNKEKNHGKDSRGKEKSEKGFLSDGAPAPSKAGSSSSAGSLSVGGGAKGWGGGVSNGPDANAAATTAIPNPTKKALVAASAPFTPAAAKAAAPFVPSFAAKKTSSAAGLAAAAAKLSVAAPAFVPKAKASGGGTEA